VAAQSLAAASSILLGCVILADRGSLTLVLICAALTGATMAFDIPARQAFAAELVSRRALPSAIGLNSTAFNLGRSIGPALAGVVTTAVGVGGCFLLNGASFLPAIAFFLSHPARRKTPPTASISSTNGLTAGYAEVLRLPGVAGLLAVMAAVQLVGGPYTALTPALAGNVLGEREVGYSVLLFANGLGALLGSLWVATLHGLAPRRLGGLYGALLMAAGLASLGIAPTLWFAAPAMAAAGAGFVVFLTSTNSTLQLLAPDHLRGRVVSLWILTFGASQPLGNLLAGWSAPWGGARGVFLRGSVGMLLCAAAIAWVHERARKKLESEG
jgi:predicted MFS family arabinose efflux permease